MVDIPQTPNFKFYKPPFDRRAWHRYINENFSVIDAVLTTYLDVSNIVGVWQNSTGYTVGQRVIDPDVGQVFECNVNHTSDPSPATFAENRTSDPTYWTSLAVTARAVGAWAPGTVYQPNDFVVSGTIYAVCINSHTSSAVFADDAANWEYLIDLSGLSVLPSFVGNALKVLRVKNDESDAEWIDATALSSYLSLGTMALQNAASVAITGGTIAGITDLAVADGGTGASTGDDACDNIGAARLNTANTFTGAITIDLGAAATTGLHIESDDDTATATTVVLRKDSPSPASNDIIGRVIFTGNNDAIASINYGRIETFIGDPSAGSEDGIIQFITYVAGSSATRFRLGGGLYSINATGGDKGDGTFNAADGMYIEGDPVGRTVTFSAHRNGVALAIPSATTTVVPFATEVWDIGGFYNGGTGVWTPPAGKYQIHASLQWDATGGVDNELLSVYIYKNGGQQAFFRTTRGGATGTPVTAISYLVDANGTDDFTIVALKAGAGAGQVNGSSLATFFQATAL